MTFCCLLHGAIYIELESHSCVILLTLSRLTSPVSSANTNYDAKPNQRIWSCVTGTVRRYIIIISFFLRLTFNTLYIEYSLNILSSSWCYFSLPSSIDIFKSWISVVANNYSVHTGHCWNLQGLSAFYSCACN